MLDHEILGTKKIHSFYTLNYGQSSQLGENKLCVCFFTYKLALIMKIE
jgi:hypothetical protein